MAANALPVTEATFAQEVLQSPIPVLIDFGAAWCPPCRVIAPTIDQLAAERAGSLKVVTVDVDANMGLAGQFAVQSMPTLIVMHKGQPVAKIVGARPKPELVRFVDAALAEVSAK